MIGHMSDLSRRPTRFLALAVVLLALTLTVALLAACHKSEQSGDATAAGGSTPGAPAAGPANPPAPATPATPLKVVALGIGKAVGPDNKVTAEVDTFAPADTFYAAVGTTGGPPAVPAKLTARWASVSHSGTEKSISEETKSISPTGDASTEFHVAKAGGWPAGDYKVEILLDGQSVAVKAFRVAR
jgi:hypothetical protein